jgi:hypothetical protein
MRLMLGCLIISRHLAESVPGNWAGFFGIVIPLLETRLGIALILGALSLPAAPLSLLALITYWSSDQLIVQYPIMGMLAVRVHLGTPRREGPLGPYPTSPWVKVG